MITDNEKLYYLIKLHWIITSKHVRQNYCWNCFHSHRTKYKLKKHNDVCEDHDYCYIEMLKEGNKVLKYNHEEMEDPLIIFADWESLRERIDTCHNNPKKSSMT